MENILKISFYENVFRIFYLLLVDSIPILMHNVQIVQVVWMKGSGVWRAKSGTGVCRLMNESLPGSKEAFLKTTQALSEKCPKMRPKESSLLPRSSLCGLSRLFISEPIPDQGDGLVNPRHVDSGSI